MIKNPLREGSGRSRIGPFFFLLLIAAGIYLVFELMPFWVQYFTMKDYLFELAQSAELATDDNLRGAVKAKAVALAIPVREEDIEIARFASEISLSVRWTIRYTFFNVYTHAFRFAPTATAYYR